MILTNENEKLKTDQPGQKEAGLSIPLLVGGLLISLLFAVGSSLSSMRRIFISNTSDRKILSKIFAEYKNQTYVIFKIKTEHGIDLEIFEKDQAKGQQRLKQKFALNEDADAYLMVNSNALNLGLVDVNNDNQLDIVAPTVDKGGNSRLNVFQYNADLNQFVPAIEGE